MAELEIDARSDVDVQTALYRILLRQMPMDRTFALVAGSIDDLRRTVATALPDLDPTAIERREEPAVLRALLRDIAASPDASILVDGCFDRNRGTILREVTPSLVLTSLVLALWPALDCSYIDPRRREGLLVKVKPGAHPATFARHAREAFAS